MPNNKIHYKAVIMFLTSLLPVQTMANDSVVLDRVMVVGSSEKAKDIPGSAHYIGKQSLEKHSYTDINRVLREVPGLNIQEEEGYGNRPNIGIRGSRNDRSASITLMEDGVLISPAPYASPSAYYFPRVDRMEAVEVRKGSSSIKFGPRTTTGAVNLISSSVPRVDEKNLGSAKLTGGEFGTQGLQLNAGKTVATSNGNFGFVVDLGHEKSTGFKVLDTGGDTGFSIQDIMGKVKWSTPASTNLFQSVEVKIGATQEDSDETYLGLSNQDFENTPYRRYAASQRDNMDTRHEQYQIRHYIEPAEGWDVTTTAYRNNFSRNWYKLDRVNGNSIASILDNPGGSDFNIIQGGDSTANAVDIKANNRDYYAYGLQSNIGKEFNVGGVNNVVEAGIRYHYDQEDRLQHRDHYQMVNGILQLTTAGIPGDAGNRIVEADAWAFHVTDEIKFGPWTLNPGVRYETIDLRRENYREGASPDSNRSDGPTGIFEHNVDAIVPGMGANFKVNENLNLIAGIHKGFSPPAPPSNALDTPNEEESINYEAGFRYGKGAFETEIIGFFNDYDNLLGRCTESSGGCTVGDNFNGGEVDVYGAEVSAQYDVAKLVNTDMKLPVKIGYTNTQAEFQTSFAAGDFDEWGTVTKGDTVPYVPEHTIFLRAGIGDEEDKWEVNLTGNFVSDMRTKTETQEAVDGTGEGTDEHFVMDVSGEVEVHKNARAFVSVDNVLNEEYIVARRPAGARPGKPQTILAGLKIKF